MLNKKKGQINGPLVGTVGVIFALFFIAILIYAFTLAGSQMKSATTDNDAKGVMGNLTSGAGNFSGFTPTLWIMAAVGALISIVIVSVGAYIYGRSQ